MKILPDTNGSKASQALLPGLSSLPSQKASGQSNRGFADNLRDQINAAAATSGRQSKAGKADAAVTADPAQPVGKTRGTELPAQEQKLPQETERVANKPVDATDNRKSRDGYANTDAGEPVVQPPAAVSGSHEDAATEPDAGDMVAATDSVNAPTAAAGKVSDTVLVNDYQVTAELQIMPETLVPGVALPVAEVADLVNPALNPAVGVISDDSSAHGSNNLLSGLLAAGSATDGNRPGIITARAVSADASAAPLVPPAAEIKALNMPDGLLITFADMQGRSASDVARTQLDTALTRQHAASPDIRAGAAPAVTAAPESSVQLQAHIAGLQPSAPLSHAAPASSQAQAAVFASNTAAGNGLLDDLAAPDMVTDEQGDLTFAGKLLALRTTQVMAGQAAGVFQTVNWAQPALSSAGFAELPSSAALLQSLTTGLSSDAAGLDAALAPQGSQTPATTNGHNTSATGLSAALYSLEQRQAAAAEARHLQAQNGRSIDTGLSTTSALKLPGLDVAFGQAGWADRIGRQVLLQSAQGTSSAQIRLDPPELGSLTVKIQLVDQSAAVNFVSPHAMVRDALEQQAGRLQEMFLEQGMDLLDVSVSDQSAESDSGSPKNSEEFTDASAVTIPGDSISASTADRQSDALIDFYA